MWTTLDHSRAADIIRLRESLLSAPKSSIFDTVSYARIEPPLEVTVKEGNRERETRIYPLADSALFVLAFVHWIKGRDFVMPANDDPPTYRIMITAAEITLRCFNDGQTILPFKTTGMSLGELLRTMIKFTDPSSLRSSG